MDSYDQAFELSLAASVRFGWHHRNTARNPFTFEGKKSVALAIAADSLGVGAARNTLLALREERDSGGAGVLVSDEAILDAIGRLARSTGVVDEPAAAAARPSTQVGLSLRPSSASPRR